MIVKVTRGSGFAGLVRYLETGKDGASPDRVDLAEATLKETRIDLQAAVMLAELQGAVVDVGE